MPAPLKVHLALLPEPQQPWEGPPLLLRQTDTLARHGGHAFTPTAAPDEADLIVFLESNHHKDWRALPALLAHPLLRQHPGRCFTLNYADTPVALLPGLYVNLPRSRHRPDWTRPSGYYIGSPNPCIAEFEHSPPVPAPHLFSFCGAASHPLRRALFARADLWRAHGPVNLIPRWFNHTPDELRSYCAEIVHSRFVLCPRGIGGATHRLFEVMRLGRVPVILSDDWAPPAGPDWPSFTLTIPEASLDALPDLLTRAAPQAEALGRLARQAWETWFSPETSLLRQLQDLRSLAHARAALPAPDFPARWCARSFRHSHGWTLPQRLLNRTRRLCNQTRARLCPAPSP